MIPDKQLSFQKLVMYPDLNNNGKCFGGVIASAIDEAGALYVMKKLNSNDVVTVKMSTILFKKPVHLGDFLEFEVSTLSIGTSSITIKVEVFKRILNQSPSVDLVTYAELTFVHIDPSTGKSKPHILSGSLHE